MALSDTALTADEIAQLTEQDWKNRLTDEEYHILREKGTERAFTGFYTDVFDKGVYRCKGCNAELFNSDNKYQSSCGWPSFDKTINDKALTETLDLSHGMRRIEVTCTNCGGHLGHVFPDGPTDTTGMRYCINSASIHLDNQ